MNLQIVPLQPKHADIVPYLRKSDVEEIHAAAGLSLSPSLAVAFSIAQTERGYAAILDGKTAAIFGIARGVIWLVATDEIEKHPVTFYRISKKIFPKLKQGYSKLENYVYEKNTLSLRWLKWLGFTIEPARGSFHYIHYEEE